MTALLVFSAQGCGSRSSFDLDVEASGGGASGSIAGPNDGAGGKGGSHVAGSAGSAGASIAPKKCAPNTWANDAAACTAWTDCPRGTYVGADGTTTSDRQCIRCPSGQTTTGLNSAACRPVVVVDLAAGYLHTCALLSDGSVKCWGQNRNGELGYGNTEFIGDNELPSSVGPVSITTTPGVVVVGLAAGDYHNCALLSDGSVKCWGQNGHGELGYSSTENIGDDELPSSMEPVSITTTPGIKVVRIGAGQSHTCALLSDGSVKCWGYNRNGKLGYGNTQDIGDDELPSSVGAVSITKAPGITVSGLAVGVDHNCALLSDGSVKCWGNAIHGELGYGNTQTIGDDELPSSVGAVSVTTTPGLEVTGITVGGDFTCVLLSDGSVKSWGGNFLGDLGHGNAAPKGKIGDDELPSSVGPISITTTPEVAVIGLAASGYHTCALLTGGSIQCWGFAGYGSLGYGNTQTIGDDELPSSVGPVSITTTPGVTVVKLAVGGYHTCVLFSNDSVKCWGRGDEGQLGYGNTDDIGDNELPS